MPARLVIVAVAVLALAGCSAPAAAPSSAPASSTTAPTSATTSKPIGYDANGSATDNQPYFDSIVKPLVQKNGLPPGASVISALVKAGFDKSKMELTPDKTAIGLDADSIEFSVKLNGTCLVGQFGSFGYRSAVFPLLTTDKCLIGSTVPLD